MEILDVYDINRNKLNKTIVRGEVVETGNYFLVVHVCVFNSNGEMLIQQRQTFKKGWPNKWDITVGGCAIKGETSQAAAERELFEEIGLKVDLKNIRPHITVNFNNGYDDVYLIEKDVDINELKLQYEEVQDVKWASKEEIFSMIDSGEFMPYYHSLIESFFDMRKHYGFFKIN
jgi:isopentenyldiphosphate isomerase